MAVPKRRMTSSKRDMRRANPRQGDCTERRSLFELLCPDDFSSRVPVVRALRRQSRYRHGYVERVVRLQRRRPRRKPVRNNRKRSPCGCACVFLTLSVGSLFAIDRDLSQRLLDQASRTSCGMSQ